VVLEKSDPLTPLSVGNGEFAFTADITGLQTLPDYHQQECPWAHTRRGAGTACRTRQAIVWRMPWKIMGSPGVKFLMHRASMPMADIRPPRPGCVPTLCWLLDPSIGFRETLQADVIDRLGFSGGGSSDSAQVRGKTVISRGCSQSDFAR